jgi:glycosyltransferase involved in cell wall biosynthesis
MRILVVNFFPAFYPPRSGGEQRYYYLYHHLSASFDVTLLSPTYSHHPPEVVAYSPTFREHRVPKDPVFDHLHWKLDAAGIGPECSAYVVAIAGGTDTAFGRRFRELVEHHDVVIHESPFTLPYDHTFGVDGKPRIYDAYNVESRLAAQILRGEAGAKAVAFIRFLEESLVGTSSLVLATCEEERRLFINDFGADATRTLLVPNGFEPSIAGSPCDVSPQAGDGDAPYVVFMGSAHPPNVEGGRFVVEQLAPALPDLEFRILGAVCGHLPKDLPSNVKRLGFVEEAEKRRQLVRCRAALNPLFSGAGTNVKMVDYMAAGAPVVSTAIGARGLALDPGVDVFIADREGFVRTLADVVHAPARARAVGAAAREKAFSQYTWATIANGLRHAIQSIMQRESRDTSRPLLLAVNDFSIAEPTSGGQVRIRELLTELGREFDVVLLCLTGERRRSERRIAAGLEQISIPKTALHREAEAVARGDPAVSVDDLIAAEFCASNAELVATFRALSARAAAVIFEHPFLAPLLDLLPAAACVVYSSLNVETDLKAVTLASRRDGPRWISQVAALERRMLDRADLVVCVSDSDRERLRDIRPDACYEVIASGARLDGLNGCPVDDARGEGLLSGRPFAVFIGSGHTPNIAAARFLVDVVAPALPQVAFGIVGSVCGALDAERCPPNVLRFGLLTEAEKAVLLSHATLAVNPLFDGGGSSLKVPDFFAAALPVVSTRVGVRGFHLRDGEHYIEAHRDDFVSATRRLLADEALRRRLGASARAYCEAELDWRILGARYRRTLRALIGANQRPRVLVVTYRFADPPPGGAEAFLVNVLRELDQRGTLVIDVATCDVGNITNKWHFSAQYDAPANAPPDPPYVRRLYRFAVDPRRVSDLANCARLFAMAMEESRRQAERLLRLYDAPLLLGGWNYLESHTGMPARWTSAEAHVFVGRGATAMRIVAIPPQATHLEVLRGSEVVAARTVCERFDWTLDLPAGDPVVSLRVARTFVPRDDPRELGVFIVALSVRIDPCWVPADLADDFAVVARRRDPEAWVRSLIEIAQARDRRDDDLFVTVRGPHSRDLHRWLEDNVASYDVVLTQGVPFTTPVVVTDLAVRQGVSVVVLPHFHMEDPYYHWQRYYDTFRRARSVIASSSRLKALVFDAIGATSVALPGGGVDPREYDPSHLPARQCAFRSLHPSSTPFVLVLGRKAPSKNYSLIVDAVAAVNRNGHHVDLVVIGPDEDGAPIAAPHTYYYGAQDREVVLGALSLALCLVNMSESESFGIVLLESWLSGRPVVAQRRCLAFADLVTPGEDGFLAESVDEVARAIQAYLADGALANRHAACGRARAADYSWARLAERIESALLEAASATRRAAVARAHHV